MIGALAALLACSAPDVPRRPSRTKSGSLAIRGARLPGGAAIELLIRDGVIEYAGPSAPRGDRERDLEGRTVVPQVIDSHVHLAYWPVAGALAKSGVVGVADLAAPIATLGERAPLRVAASGPMITATRGYPTRSWGAAGYGLEVASAAEARRAVRDLVRRGAALVKVAVGEDGLSRPQLEAVVDAAHAAGVRVAAHALSAGEVELAAEAGVDILAHAPVAPLTDAGARRWAGRHVITTLSAFAPERAAENLRRLVAAGAVPIYGTDLGNTRELGVSRAELAAMRAAGLSPRQILESMTAAPATLWGWDDLGAIVAGKRARLLVLDRDPLEDVMALAAPVEVL